eukprot:365188-Chlamydomonas_euryale.AAC.13
MSALIKARLPLDRSESMQAAADADTEWIAAVFSRMQHACPSEASFSGPASGARARCTDSEWFMSRRADCAAGHLPQSNRREALQALTGTLGRRCGLVMAVSNTLLALLADQRPDVPC